MAMPKWAILVGVVGAGALGYYLYKRQKSKKAGALPPLPATPATGATACEKIAATINRSRGSLAKLKPAWATQCKRNGGQIVYVRSASGANQQACVCKS